MHKINHANIKDWAKNYDGPLFDGILCDPPYHLVSMTKRWGSEKAHNTPIMDTKEGGVFARSAKGFMGKDWDGVDENGIGIAQDPEMWRLLYNLLKPGAHLLAFSGSRTYHRMAVAIEDAGFEIRDMIEWVYGSGFPKSLNIGKAVDKIQGNEREVVDNPYKNRRPNGNAWVEQIGNKPDDYTKGNSEWEGWGTALKPAHEPCVLARKPLEKGHSVAQNALKHGTGGLAIDKCRVGTGEQLGREQKKSHKYDMLQGGYKDGFWDNTKGLGRFPANLIHDGSDEVVGLFPETKSGKTTDKQTADSMFGKRIMKAQDGSQGSAARFFYCAKASKSERNAGLEGFEIKDAGASMNSRCATCGKQKLDYESSRCKCEVHIPAEMKSKKGMQNVHPTVKPLSLTKYLATLIKPPTGGRLLVPFSGSGSEMIGALQAGWEYVEGVELTEEYIPIAEARIKYWQNISQTSSKPKVSAKNAEPVQNTAESLTLF